MARANKNNANTRTRVDKATATISGTLKEVYEGKKYDYATIRVEHGYDEYYDLFEVACSKNFQLPDDGEFITLNCVMKNYKGKITFKEISADTQ